MTRSDEVREWQRLPSVAALAVGRERVAVMVQSTEGAEVDHRKIVAAMEAHGMSC